MRGPSHLPAYCRVVGRFRGAPFLQLHAGIVGPGEDWCDGEIRSLAQWIGESHQPADRLIRKTSNVDDGPENDSHIEPERSIGNIPAIEHGFLTNRLNGRIGRQLDLGESRDTRLDPVSP